MDVPAMHLEQHERGIHVVRSGARPASEAAWPYNPDPPR
jgi:hypothetical protein